MSFSTFVNKSIFQQAHIYSGALISLWSCMVLGAHYGWIPGVVFYGIKEFIFDPKTEDPATSGGPIGDAIDFTFGCLGVLAGYGLYKLAGKL